MKRGRMLPFLKNKQAASPGLTVINRTPDQPEESDDSGIEACAQDLITAVHNRDTKAVASALKAAWDVLDSSPDSDSDSDTDSSYDSMNAAAAKGQD